MEECPQSGSGTSVDSSVFFGVVFIFGPRHWNDEPTSKSSAKMTFLFVPFSEYGKHTSAVVSWSASKTPDCFGKLGRRGKDACGIRESLKVCAASKSHFNYFCLAYKISETSFRCRACFCSAFPDQPCVVSPPALAQAPCYATGRAGLCNTICSRPATISRSFQMARAIACAPEAFPPGEDCP